MAAIDAVNNNNSNTAAYTTGAAAAGAIGGGAYGYFIKPYLTKGMPNDAFCKMVCDKRIESAGDYGKYMRSMFDNIQKIKNANTPKDLVEAAHEYVLYDIKDELASVKDNEKVAAFNNIKNSIISDMREYEAKLPNMADLVKKAEEAKTVDELRDAFLANLKAEIEVKGFELVKKDIINDLKEVPNTIEEAGKAAISDMFDVGKKEFNFEGVADDVKKPINEAMSSMKKNAAMKWAAIAAVAAGVVGYIVSKCCEKPEDIQEKGMKAYQG